MDNKRIFNVCVAIAVIAAVIGAYCISTSSIAVGVICIIAAVICVGLAVWFYLKSKQDEENVRIEAEKRRKAEQERQAQQSYYQSTAQSEPEREFKGKLINRIVKDYVVIDIETTGLDPQSDDILEIGAIKYENHVEVARFETFVKPRRKIPQKITDINGITDDMVEDAPSQKEAVLQFYAFAGNSVLIGHNVNFDINFIYDKLIKRNIKLSNDFCDTYAIAKRTNHGAANNKLTTLAEYFQIHTNGAHRAIADCETTHELYMKLNKIAG